jgi:hypothetical protein
MDHAEEAKSVPEFASQGCGAGASQAGTSPPDAPVSSSAEDPHTMVASRSALPVTRDSLTHKFMIARHEGYLTIGLYPDGRPGEIFIKMAKEGSTISGMCQAFCRAFSLAIQHGLSIEESVARFKGMRFEPMGPTNNPDIPEAQSIVDYVARFLEVHYAVPKR